MVFHHGVFHQVISHQSGLSSRWSVFRVVGFHHCVFHRSGLSSECLTSGWSLIRESFIRVVIHQGVFHQGGDQGGHSSGSLSSGWSFIRVVLRQSGLSSHNVHREGVCYITLRCECLSLKPNLCLSSLFQKRTRPSVLDAGSTTPGLSPSLTVVAEPCNFPPQ